MREASAPPVIGDHGKKEWITYAFLGVSLIGVQVALVYLLVPEVLEGSLFDPDSYSRLVRVAQLRDTGSWFDTVLLRMNAPYGLDFHWTRPLDLILLGGSWILAPALGSAGALYWSGALVSPILHFLACMGLAWAVRPLFGPGRSALVIIVLLAQPILTGYALAGRADHHLLLVLAYVVALGFFLRFLVRSDGSWDAALGGAVAGLGLWSSIEFLLPLATLYGSLVVLWLSGFPKMTRKGALFSAGLVIVVFGALLAEHPLSNLLQPEYDRVSAPHMFLALLGLVFWLSVEGLAGRTSLMASARGRVLTLGAAAVVAGSLILVTYPGIFSNPIRDVDPEFWRLYGQYFAEYRSFLSGGIQGFGYSFVYLGAATLAVPFGLWMLSPRHRSDLRAAWIPVCIGLAVFVPLALAQLRFAVWAGVVIAVSLTGVLCYLNERLEYVENPLRRSVLRVSSNALILTGFMMAGLGMIGLSGDGDSSAVGPRTESCSVRALAGVLREGRLADPRRTILTNGNIGPEIVYRTRHAVVAAPYHRNAEGVLDTHRIMTSTDPGSSRRGMEARGVDLVAVCPRSDAAFFGEDSPAGETLFSLLVDGRPPPWLRPLDTPRVRETGFLLFEVVDG